MNRRPWVKTSVLLTVLCTMLILRHAPAEAGFSGGATTAGEPEEKAKAEIVALIDRFDDAINAGDVPGSVAVYGQDAESFPLFSQKYSTSAQRLAAAKRAAESGVKVTTKRNDDLKVRVVGDNWAWAYWTWHAVSVTPQGVRNEADGRTTFILEKRGGDWKVVHSHISEPNRPGGSPPPAQRP